MDSENICYVMHVEHLLAYLLLFYFRLLNWLCFICVKCVNVDFLFLLFSISLENNFIISIWLKKRFSIKYEI